jgi:hypothetical protein
MREKELYDLCKKHDGSYELLKAMESFLEEVSQDIKGVENAQHYDTLRKLSDSINNAGHEERRSDDIHLINNAMSAISQEYDEYLP